MALSAFGVQDYRISKADRRDVAESALMGGGLGAGAGIRQYRKGKRATRTARQLRSQAAALPASAQVAVPGYLKHAEGFEATASKLKRIGNKRAAIGAGIGALTLGGGSALRRRRDYG